MLAECCNKRNQNMCVVARKWCTYVLYSVVYNTLCDIYLYRHHHTYHSANIIIVKISHPLIFDGESESVRMIMMDIQYCRACCVELWQKNTWHFSGTLTPALWQLKPGEAIDDIAKEQIDEEDEDISKQLLININSSWPMRVHCIMKIFTVNITYDFSFLLFSRIQLCVCHHKLLQSLHTWHSPFDA